MVLVDGGGVDGEFYWKILGGVIVVFIVYMGFLFLNFMVVVIRVVEE